MDERAPLIKGDDTPNEPPPDYDTAAKEHGAAAAAAAPPPAQPARPRAGTLRKPPAPLEIPILQHLRTHKVVLASASPRRKALLGQIGLPNVAVRPSTKPENLSKTALGPFEYVGATARQKALDVYASAVAAGEDPDVVIAADTVIVTRDGRVLEKPSSEAVHVRMLKHLRDSRVHRVLTAITCVAPKADATHPGYELASHVEETKVFFAGEADGLPDDVIESYVRTREGVDKAGGYAIQGVAGMVLVEKVEGSVDNVVGLPVRMTLQLCEKVIFKQNEESGAESDEEEV